MLEEVLRSLNNWFVKEIQRGSWTIEDGIIAIENLQPNQYFRIVGSVFNDGVYQCPTAGLIDEAFTGEVWLLAIPQEILSITDEIEAWQVTNKATDLTSESFGGYSYSRATDANGAPLDWQGVFRKRLNRYRRL